MTSSMGMSDPHRCADDLGRRSRRWWAASLTLLLAGSGAISVAALADDRSLDTTQERAVSPSGPGADQPSSRAAPADAPSLAKDRQRPKRESGSRAVPRSAPTTLSIPAIGLEAAVIKLGLRPDSTVEVPTDPDKTGWFRLGPSPGQEGSAVILGHVDSHEGPAVFIMLRYLSAGDRVAVTLANGRVATFVVERRATYPNEDFPAQRIYGSHGRPMLQLVTCGGDYDNDVGYTANVVVYTSLVSISRRH